MRIEGSLAVLLICPLVGLSTAQVYQNLQLTGDVRTEGEMRQAVERGPVLRRLHRRLEDLLQAGLDAAEDAQRRVGRGIAAAANFGRQSSDIPCRLPYLHHVLNGGPDILRGDITSRQALHQPAEGEQHLLARLAAMLDKSGRQEGFHTFTHLCTRGAHMLTDFFGNLIFKRSATGCVFFHSYLTFVQ